MRLRPLLPNILLLLASCAVSLLIAEAVLSITFGRPHKPLSPDTNLMIYDGYLGWKHSPNYDNLFQHDDHSPRYWVHTNSFGMRGDEPVTPKPAGISRVLMLGDSITFGFTETPETIAAQLQKRLGKRYEVLNAGVIAYAPDQTYLQFMGMANAVRPDIVVLQITLGDIIEMTLSMKDGLYKPYFRMNRGRLELYNTPIPRIKVLDVMFRDKPFKRFLYKHSSIYRFLFYKLQGSYRLNTLDIKAISDNEALEVFDELTRKLHDKCSEIGCTVVLFITPVDMPFYQPTSQHMRPVFRHIAETAGALKIPFVDMHGDFAGHYKEKLYVPSDPLHPNRRGNFLIAKKLALAIKADRR